MITVKEMIANHYHPIMNTDDFMEVMEDEESREEKPRAPERVRNPGIEVEVIWGRRIVSNHRWAVPVIVIVDHRRLGVLRTCRRWSLGIFSRGIDHHR